MSGWACRAHGVHHEGCTGVTSLGEACLGCAPAEATAGMLCASCWRKLVQVDHDIMPYLAYLRTGPSSVRVENIRVKTSTEPSIPIPASVLAAHDLGAYVGDWYRYWGTELRDIVTSPDGARAAVELYREVQRVQRKWPAVDRAHRVPYVKCRACKKLGLVYKPPLEYRGDIVVQCRFCHAVEPYELMLLDAMVLEQEQAKTGQSRRAQEREQQ